MNQDENSDEEYKFPEGYEYIKDMAEDAARLSKELDERIKNIPTEDIRQTKHRLQFNAPGMAKAMQAYVKRENKENLEEQKKQIEVDLMKRIDKDLKQNEVDPKTATQIKYAAIEIVHPNPFKGKSKEEMEKARVMEKDPQHSQDFMRKLLYDERKKAKEVEVVQTESKQQTEISMSARFSQILGYNKYTEKTKEIIQKQPIVKKGIEPGKA